MAVAFRKENASNEVEKVVNVLESLAHEVHTKLGARMHRLAIAGWEIRVRLKELQAANGAWRVVVSNPTGHTCTVQVRVTFHLTMHQNRFSFTEQFDDCGTCAGVSRSSR